MVKRVELSLLALVLLVAAGCPKKPTEVVKSRFPVCFEEQMIGADRGARCQFDGVAEEWRITFWRGWGDCPAGCIHVEDYAWFIVDGKGRVFECDREFNRLREVPGEGPIMASPPPAPEPPESLH